ncbi:hypothetical protein TNCV_891071 [Trichonephila clavipes]|nr:hypothetical protein TNCV_891071 [Trichonephila clavipes]
MSDAGTVAAVSVNEKLSEKDKDLNVENTVQMPKISHSEVLRAVRTTLQDVEQQDTSVMILLFHRYLYDEAAKRRVQY